MQRLLFFAFVSLLLAGCGSETTFTDNGNPGQIRVVIFQDTNQNGVMDGGEPGRQAQVAISQDISCPPTTDINWVDTNAEGVALFTELKPGKYCVLPSSNGLSMTTKMTQEVFVSSDAVTETSFGFSVE